MKVSEVLIKKNTIMSHYISSITLILFHLWILLILSSPSATSSENIVMSLEEPASSSTYSGVANVRGWAVALQDMEKVELYVDNQFSSNLPLGGRRVDVGNAYPNYPGSAQSGFAIAFNYSNLTAGSHTFTVRAIDTTGDWREVRVTANVVRFDNAYMSNPAMVNLDQTTVASIGNTITIQNLVADGKRYNVQLGWSPATQGFSINVITHAGTSYNLTGNWGGTIYSLVYSETYSITAHVIQNGTNMSGYVTIPILSMVNANLTGQVVSGNTLTGNIGGTIAVTATVSANGNTISGSFTNSELYDYGTWQMTRTQ